MTSTPGLPAALLAARVEPPVLEVLEVLQQAGYQAWIVGGAVRDLLLERARPGGDFDLATSARPGEVKALFRRVIPTGEAHGTVTVAMRGALMEVTTFRGEGAYLDGRRPASVTFLDDVEADLARRDFTVNAMAWDPLGGRFRDPFGGQEDLRRRLLRAVGDAAARFAEDGLRPYRAARFAAQLGFELEPITAAAIPGALAVARRVAAERVAEELSRLVMAPHARQGLRLLDASGLLGLALPELAALPAGLRGHAFAAAAASPRTSPRGWRRSCTSSRRQSHGRRRAPRCSGASPRSGWPGAWRRSRPRSSTCKAACWRRSGPHRRWRAPRCGGGSRAWAGRSCPPSSRCGEPVPSRSAAVRAPRSTPSSSPCSSAGWQRWSGARPRSPLRSSPCAEGR